MDLLDQLSGILGDTTAPAFEVKHWLDTGYAPLNKAISGKYSGGMPSGRIVEMFGPPSSGKTAIATSVMANAVAKGGFAMFMDHERSFDINLARKIGLDDTVGRFAHMRPKTFEESFSNTLHTAEKIRTEELIPADAPIVAVYDSLAAMIPRSKYGKNMDETTMADKLALASATSQTFPIVNQYADEFDMLCLVLNQTREDPNARFNKVTTTGGKAPAYYASVRISLVPRHLVDEKSKDRRKMGQKIIAECIKNKVSAPFQKAEWNFLYMNDGSGRFDIEGGTVEALIELGIIKQAGAWVTFPDGEKCYKKDASQKVRDNGWLDNLVAQLVALDDE